MATKKKVTKETKVVDEAKAAKRKARMEALKNRPEGQRPNSKQIDIINTDNGAVKNYGYAVKNKDGYQGVLVTSVLENKDGQVISTSVTFIPGKLTVKSKKGHGVICTAKSKKDKNIEESEDNED
jgi:hypothetical protein|nr:MAG TPA: hypothetical protein [Caudoviricetes sp.]